MRILALVQGNFGKRKAENIRKHMPREWSVEVHELPRSLPLVIDDIEQFFPGQTGADLLLALGESPAAAQLIPEIAKLIGAKAVIACVDNHDWLPEGMMTQVKKELASSGIDIVFPTPFCVLAGSKNRYIAEFAKHFGKPELKIKVEGDKIKSVEVLRDAPCGNTRYVARRLVGVSVRDALIVAQQYHHQYPCLASPIKERRRHDNLMNRAGRLLEAAVRKEVRGES